MAPAPLMRFRTCDLRIRYPAQTEWAVDGVNIDIAPGTVTWLTGALGSGTSTLLLALAGLVPRVTGGELEGVVLSDDKEIAALDPLTRRVAYLGPAPSVQLSGIAKTVHDEVAVGPMNLGWSRDRILPAVADALRQLQLDHLAARAPDALSGGETQRVLLASMLAISPATWLMDEPFSALDHATTGQVQQLLRAQAAAGATVVVACDDADAMLDVADRLVVMQRGRVVLDGDPRALLAGDEILATGAGTTDAATLAHAAGMAAPRPLTRPALLERIRPTSIPENSAAASRYPRVSVALSATDHPGSNAPDGSNRNVASGAVLEMANVAFSYRNTVPVLNGVGFSVGPGEAVGLFGVNGAGKSTLLRLAMALEHPAAGTIVTRGTATAGRHPEDLAPGTGFLFQQPERQLFASSVWAECALAPRLAGWTSVRTAQAVDKVLSELGLADTAKEHPYDLPLPRRRLVALAAILAADPDLVLLDEPTAALDFTSRERVIHVLRERVGRGKTVVAITHDAIFAHEALQRGMVLEHGQLVYDGPIRGVIDDGRMFRPAALVVALELQLRPGNDRREDVADVLRRN